MNGEPSAQSAATEIAELHRVVRQLNDRLDVLMATNLALVAENERLRRQVGMSSKNSSKPPSSDGYAKPPPKSRRVRSGNKPGKQPGADGKHLAQVASPDVTTVHAPGVCTTCKEDLADAPVVGMVRRQVFDLPVATLAVTEHRAERRRCPCGSTTVAPFPDEATAPACYGPMLRGLVCYLVVRQHIPVKRVCELLADSYGAAVSTGAIVAMVAEGAGRLEGFVGRVTNRLRRSEVVHVDETGLRVGAKLRWVHAASTAELVAYHLDDRRGPVGVAGMDVLPHLRGVLCHDGWPAYRSYTNVAHALCNAHHLRELAGLADDPAQPWARAMAALLADACHRVSQAKADGRSALPSAELLAVQDAYDAVISAGRRTNPPTPLPAQRGHPKRTVSANLLRRLDTYATDVLRFATDFSVPFDNNEAERSVRMVKVQQKISGGFRSVEGARGWLALRSYVGTAIKQGINPLGAMQRLALADPWMPGEAWRPE